MLRNMSNKALDALLVAMYTDEPLLDTIVRKMVITRVSNEWRKRWLKK